MTVVPLSEVTEKVQVSPSSPAVGPVRAETTAALSSGVTLICAAAGYLLPAGRVAVKVVPVCLICAFSMVTYAPALMEGASGASNQVFQTDVLPEEPPKLSMTSKM